MALSYLFIYGSIGVWTQVLHLESLHQLFFVMGFFKILARKLFAQVGFESQSSWPLPPE
jgi:hypothetical protein